MNSISIVENMKKYLSTIGVVLFLSCNTPSRLVYKERINGYRIRFFIKDSLQHREYLSDLYAKVDSSDIKIYYSFFQSNVTKAYSNNNNIRYTLTSIISPMATFTKMDNVVLEKADYLMDSLGYKILMRAKGATGYNIEVIKTLFLP